MVLQTTPNGWRFGIAHATHVERESVNGLTKKLTDPATIRINHDTLKRLKAKGKYGEILDDIINRLLDDARAQCTPP
uniref:Uncharacterized protein n=1 Tax=viral metagenome TaxID=1070528 RepID=A0A6H1ZZ19_9ZZZZ